MARGGRRQGLFYTGLAWAATQTWGRVWLGLDGKQHGRVACSKTQGMARLGRPGKAAMVT